MARHSLALAMLLRFLGVLALGLPLLQAESPPVRVRVVAANLTSGSHQSYSADNGNHSNPEGAGARILKGLKPDVVLIQEFNAATPLRQWVNQTFGDEYSFTREEGEGIPNGIISRFPIIESGEWDDAVQDNRDFAWAKVRLPNGKNLWAISVHLYSRKPAVRAQEASELMEKLRAAIPAEDLVILGGDFNTREGGEECLQVLQKAFCFPEEAPADQSGNTATNAPRNRPYDWLLADADLDPFGVPATIGEQSFPAGLVFDSRIFVPLENVPPVRESDSAAPGMQHMAVVRDFLIP